MLDNVLGDVFACAPSVPNHHHAEQIGHRQFIGTHHAGFSHNELECAALAFVQLGDA